jgi:hypothetical protein
MTAQERDILIERYGAEELSHAEETMIEQLAASDPEFALQLRAERTLRSAARNDAAAIPAVSDEPSAHLMSLLAATPPAVATGASGGFSVFSPLAVKIAIVTAAVLGLVVGAFIFGTWSENSMSPDSSPALETTLPNAAPSQPSSAAPPTADTDLRNADHAPQPAATTRPAPRSDSSSAVASGHARARRSGIADTDIDMNEKSKTAVDDAMSVQPVETEEPVIFTTDSVRATIRIDD